MTSANIWAWTVLAISMSKAWSARLGRPLNSFCLACFNGDYPLPVDPALDKFIMERREQRAKALADQEAQPTLFTDLNELYGRLCIGLAENRIWQLGR